jgi:hypothetical protein
VVDPFNAVLETSKSLLKYAVAPEMDAAAAVRHGACITNE